ncbi:hypothetical protein NM208_g12971 [Fusarium decemcellulare]|uniref:Uncharacterized protein n=1 Tax=Fusarium decemcellulare TaxID=57161 RepID=A0ACC1RLL2_9HYPO|nr:hypothetical protein NM208_g12971 [Fusarium decemcellulare]
MTADNEKPTPVEGQLGDAAGTGPVQNAEKLHTENRDASQHTAAPTIPDGSHQHDASEEQPQPPAPPQGGLGVFFRCSASSLFAVDSMPCSTSSA